MVPLDVNRICLTCSRRFVGRTSDIKRGYSKYCSKDCYDDWQRKNTPKGINNPLWKRIKRSCLKCLRSIWVKPARIEDGRGKYCSKECYYSDLKQRMIGRKMSTKARSKISGKNHYNWKGGRSLINRKRFKNAEWDAIKKQVYSRDNRTCQKCGKNCLWMDISCHHIKPWRESKDNSLENLVTLCRSCHARADLLGFPRAGHKSFR